MSSWQRLVKFSTDIKQQYRLVLRVSPHCQMLHLHLALYLLHDCSFGLICRVALYKLYALFAYVSFQLTTLAKVCCHNAFTIWFLVATSYHIFVRVGWNSGSVWCNFPSSGFGLEFSTTKVSCYIHSSYHLFWLPLIGATDRIVANYLYMLVLQLRVVGAVLGGWLQILLFMCLAIYVELWLWYVLLYACNTVKINLEWHVIKHLKLVTTLKHRIPLMRVVCLFWKEFVALYGGIACFWS